MSETIFHRWLGPSYVALVTALSLALVAEAASRGPSALPGVLVYALSAGFGLEFVVSRWSAESRS
jgi:hypothetical protein